MFQLQTLYTYAGNFRAFKAQIAAEYSGAKLTVDTSFKFGETNKSDAFLAKFPLGKVKIKIFKTYFFQAVYVKLFILYRMHTMTE